MILKIEHKKNINAKEIWSIFQASYTTEAKMLKATDFPPLKRTVSQFLNSNTKFYGYYLIKNLAGVIEIDNNEGVTHIQSLVVYPKYFRKGIGRELVNYVLETSDSIIFTVETGFENLPAKRLYRSFDFKEKDQWDTKHGVRKIRFEKKSLHSLLS